MFKKDDLVTRKSYNNDIVFKIVDIKEDIVILSGVNIRLCADSKEEDLVPYEDKNIDELRDDDDVKNSIKDYLDLDRNNYFYLPGKILHVDADKDYLQRCLKFYKESKMLAYGLNLNESEIHSNIIKYLDDINPDILVITGHDAFFKGDKTDINNYKNSKNFVKAIKEARKYEKSHDKLIIIAGACQSDYEELIRSGANFASSPKRINIHALDPAIVACAVGLCDRSEDIDLIGILDKTKYKSDGMGGIKTKGTMYIGYPR